MTTNNSNYYDGFNAVIHITEEYNNLIHFAGVYDTQSDDVKFVALYNGAVYESEISENKRTFDFYIPFASAGDIGFLIQNESEELFPAKISYVFPARINDLPHSFFIGDNVLATRKENSESLYVEVLEYEKLCRAVNSYINKNFDNEKYLEDKDIIRQYLAQYQEMSKKRIWLITDRRDRADDNGEYFFKYSAKIDDGIEKYFVVDEKSPDAKRLAQTGNVVYYKSAQNKLLCLFAEKFISSHLNTRLRDYCDKDAYILYAGLDKAKTVFLQHGIIIHEISGWLKRFNQNIKLFVTSSAHEYNEVLRDNYGYDKSVIKLTGLPRYDSIYDDNKKKIFFAPTWRFSVFNVSKNELQESDYYKAICRLLCDKNFIDKLKEHGYGLLFKPHPMLANIASDFEADEYVEIIPYDVSYQTLFAESSLLITDFSSTAFDFAYLKKPVIYYQFFENHMGKSYFDYKTMGFGEVVDKHDELVEMVIKYINSNCAIEEKYKQRADNFFAYFDKDNTKRVYDEIIKI